MKAIKLIDFFKYEIKPFLLGAFLSRIMEYTDEDGNKYFYAYSNFRTSKAVFPDDFNFIEYADDLKDSLNHRSGYHNWVVESVSNTCIELRFYILNDSNLSKIMFYKSLYQKVLTADWALEDNLNDQKKDFIRGFMELRGSVDTTAKLIAQDYFYSNRLELKKAQILTDIMNLPIRYANFNARNLQPQFVSGENKRNAQFRINVLYYASTIGFINKYKAQIFQNSHHTLGKRIVNDVVFYDVSMPSTKNSDITFIRYLNFFTNNIYEKELTKEAIKQLRQELNFDTENSSKIRRNQSIIALFNSITEDRCAICKTTTTFTNRKTGRQHFEIHHVISLRNGIEVDNIANFVKLCPTCHDMLKRNRADKDIQLKAILKILHEHIEIFEYTSSYLAIDDINELAEKIWTMLG